MLWNANAASGIVRLPEHGAETDLGPLDPGSEEEEAMLDPLKISEYARALYRAHGNKAEAEAASRLRQSEQTGNQDEAENWRRIRQAISQLRGPGQA